MMDERLLEMIENNPYELEEIKNEYPEYSSEIEDFATIIRGLRAKRVNDRTIIFQKEEDILSQIDIGFSKIKRNKEIESKKAFFENIEGELHDSHKPKIFYLAKSFLRVAAILVLILCSYLVWLNIPLSNNQNNYYAPGPSLTFRSVKAENDILRFTKKGEWEQVIKEVESQKKYNVQESFYIGYAYMVNNQFLEAIPYFQEVVDEQLPGYENDARFNILICQWQTGTDVLKELQNFIDDENNPLNEKAKLLKQKVINN